MRSCWDGRGLILAHLDQPEIDDGPGGEGGLEHLCSTFGYKTNQSIVQIVNRTHAIRRQIVRCIESVALHTTWGSNNRLLHFTSASSLLSTASCSCAAARTSVLKVDDSGDENDDGTWVEIGPCLKELWAFVGAQVVPVAAELSRTFVRTRGCCNRILRAATADGAPSRRCRDSSIL